MNKFFAILPQPGILGNDIKYLCKSKKVRIPSALRFGKCFKNFSIEDIPAYFYDGEVDPTDFQAAKKYFQLKHSHNSTYTNAGFTEHSLKKVKEFFNPFNKAQSRPLVEPGPENLEFNLEKKLWLNAFFYFFCSTLDSLTIVTLIICKYPPNYKIDRISMGPFVNEISKETDPIDLKPEIQNVISCYIKRPVIFDEIRGYRNVITHKNEISILHRNYNDPHPNRMIHIDGEFYESFLPRDPKLLYETEISYKQPSPIYVPQDPFKEYQNRDVLKYCEDAYNQLINFLNHVYDQLIVTARSIIIRKQSCKKSPST